MWEVLTGTSDCLPSVAPSEMGALVLPLAHVWQHLQRSKCLGPMLQVRKLRLRDERLSHVTWLEGGRAWCIGSA